MTKHGWKTSVLSRIFITILELVCVYFSPFLKASLIMNYPYTRYNVTEILHSYYVMYIVQLKMHLTTNQLIIFQNWDAKTCMQLIKLSNLFLKKFMRKLCMWNLPKDLKSPTKYYIFKNQCMGWDKVHWTFICT